MAKHEQAAVNPNSAGTQALVFPPSVDARSNRLVEDEINVSRHTAQCRRNRRNHFMTGRSIAKTGSRAVQLAALSKVVNKAFTGWTVKTEKPE